jgi:hypothetical protein
MINGAHIVLYSTDPEADRAFFRDVLRWPHVDVGEGWLIFRLPPAELGVHPADDNDRHELYLLCDDVRATVAELRARRVECSALEEQSWGRLTRLRLPGGGQIGLYEPTHERAPG